MIQDNPYYGTHTNNLNHFSFLYGPISINVVHREGPVEFVGNFPRRSYVYSQKELLKVYSSTIVSIKCSKYVFTKFFSISTRKKLRVYFQKLLSAQLASWTIPLKLQCSYIKYLNIIYTISLLKIRS